MNSRKCTSSTARWPVRVATAKLNLNGVVDPAVRFPNLFALPGEPLLVVATDPHFHIATANPDTAVGRELLAVVPTPPYVEPKVNYTYGGGPLVTEAQNWINAAKAAQTAVQHPT